ncbi:MAG TPA: sigma-70 family RNA polymerase sigma factor [Candidatus Binatia bacterium]|nr:sigma-70 family RNA polymerase sigma factor [Candidatus Binatia bacterium]
MDDVLELVRACAAGDAAARRTFQSRHAEDIYNFPVKIYGVPAERAADFYVYVFEGDRIFTRMRTFEGRNNIQFRTFLAYYVLRSLFLEWQRAMRELETVPLGDDDVEVADPAPGGHPQGPEVGDVATRLWAGLSPEDQLDLKLLSLLEHDLGPDDVRLLARVARRSVRDTVAVLAEVEADLRQKDVKLSRLRDELDSVWGWIVLRQRELQETDGKLRRMGSNHGTTTARRLLDRRQELEQTIDRRMRQRERLLEQIRNAKMTTPYKDIARLQNSSVGTVCSRIFRLRERLVRAGGTPP